MNQRADSLKKNLMSAAVKPLICQQSCFLSHTCGAMQCNQKRNGRNGLIRSLHGFCALAFDPLALDPSEHPRHRFLQDRHVLREQKESERQHPESEHR